MAVETGTTGSQTPPEPSEGVRSPENAPEAPPGGGEGASQGPKDETEGESRERTNYRRRLRETEAERDQLRAQVDGLQRSEVERLAAQAGLAVPGDVWSFGASLETLRGESGDIDAEAVNIVVGDIVASRPGLAAVKPGDLGLGRGAAATSRTNHPKVGLSQLLKP